MEVYVIKLDPNFNMKKNIALMFPNNTSKDNYFEAYATKLVGTEAPKELKNLWSLYNTITLFNEGRYPIDINYMRITVNNKHLYFFIYNYEVLGNNQVRYFIKLDTVTSYMLNETDLQLNGNQLVLREHKNRFNASKQPIYNNVIESIDIKPKNVTLLNTIAGKRTFLTLRKVGGGVDSGNQILSEPKYIWELYGNTSNAYNIDGKMELKLGWGIRFYEGTVYFKYTIAEGEALIKIVKTIASPAQNIVLQKDSSNNLVLTISSDTDMTITKTGNVNATIASNKITLRNAALNYSLITYAETLLSSQTYYDYFYDGGMSASSINYNDSNLYGGFYKDANVTATSKPFNNIILKKTDAKNQKIIKLPHMPDTVNNAVADAIIPISSTNGTGLKIDVNTDIVYNTPTMTILNKTYNTSFVPDMMRIPLNDPKLYTSQFRPVFLSWKNEVMLIKRENLPATTNAVTASIKYSASDYSKAVLKLLTSYQSNEIADTIKVVNLANDVATIKDELSSYIETQYENDRRLQDLQVAKANRDMVYNVFNQVSGIAATAIGGALVGGGIGAAVGGISAGVRTISSIAQMSQNINQMKEEMHLNYENKMKQLQYSLINITGADANLDEVNDIDLIKVYAFEPTTEELNYLDNFFYYYGYQTLEYKQPNLDTRKYFNYIQMEIINYTVNNPMVTAEVLEDIIERFRSGLTIFHFNPTFTAFNFNQDFENYERVLE